MSSISLFLQCPISNSTAIPCSNSQLQEGVESKCEGEPFLHCIYLTLPQILHLDPSQEQCTLQCLTNSAPLVDNAQFSDAIPKDRSRSTRAHHCWDLSSGF